MSEAVHITWIVLQIVIGFHLFFPLLLLFYSKLKSDKKPQSVQNEQDLDFAIIITAYEETVNLPDVVNAILNQPYPNFTVYLVADKCDTSSLFFSDTRVNILVPPTVIGSNTGSHAYAVEHFKKQHDVVTIIDSDNIIDPNYLIAIKKSFDEGFKAVQGLRAPKNLDTDYARLDAARDIYYHFYDGEVLFKAGSSATLAGSAMAFETGLYRFFEKLQS